MNLNKRVLFIDADGCLLNWLSAFCDWYNKKETNAQADADWSRLKNSESWARGKRPSVPTLEFIKPEQFIDYAMTGFPGGEENRIKLMNEFSYTAEYADLSAMCQMTSLEALVNAGYELRVLTARVDPHPDQRAKLVHNLSRKYGPVFSGVHFVPPTITHSDGDGKTVTRPYSKLEFLEKWQAEHKHLRVHVVGLVDDKPDTLRSVSDSDFRAFGIMHNFNHREWDWHLCSGRPNTKINWFDTVDQVAELLVREAMRDG